MRFRSVTLRRLHRWLGLGALVFLALLSVTGIALNHSVEWRLDDRYIDAGWLLAWYGIETPAPSNAFSTEMGDVVLVGERLYLDDREIARGIEDLVGASASRETLAVAADDSLLLFTPDGALARRTALPAGIRIDRLGRTRTTSAGSSFVLVGGAEHFLYDAQRSVLDRVDLDEITGLSFSEPATLDPGVADRIARAYRGPGISATRLLADLHSGRVFGREGPLVTDLIGAVTLLLGMTGLVIWARSARKRS